MNINASIIDQRLTQLAENIKEQAKNELNIKNDAIRLKSLAFVYLCAQSLLDLEPDETFDCLTEGGGDFGIDAIHISEEIDGEFFVTLLQAKYRQDLNAESTFPENGIEALIRAIRYIFDPQAQLQNINPRLQVKVETARSMIRDGLIPRVRAIACNNGKKWNDTTQSAIDRVNFGDQVTWEYVNHDVILKLLQRNKPVNTILRLKSKAVFEDMNFSRVCIGQIAITEIAHLMEQFGEKLLERNIRRYLGLHGNRVNEGIRHTLYSTTPENFYFYNNGLTLVCTQFRYNALQEKDYQIQLENLQIVNGGQTCMTIYKTFQEMQKQGRNLSENISVLVRIYELPIDDNKEDIVLKITHATNSQNPVDLKDLHSNDEKQLRLEESIRQLGYQYRRKRSESIKTSEISSGTAAEAVLAVWRNAPHQAKFLLREHFGKLYHKIFTDQLNGAQVVIAVLLYRIAENHRRRPMQDEPLFVRYASCFIAMQMGKHLLQEANVSLQQLDHRNFKSILSLIETKGQDLYLQARDDVQHALNNLYGLYGDQDISVQQLSATFRRGDLIGKLNYGEM